MTVSKLSFRVPEEWAEPFRMAVREVCDASVCISDLDTPEGQRTVALTSPTLPQLSLEQWAQKALAVTAAGMFVHAREGLPDAEGGGSG